MYKFLETDKPESVIILPESFNTKVPAKPFNEDFGSISTYAVSSMWVELDWDSYD